MQRRLHAGLDRRKQRRGTQQCVGPLPGQPWQQPGAGAVQMEVESCTGSAQQDWTAPLPPSTTADQTSFGPNAYIFTTSMSTASVQDTIDAIFAEQQTNQFGTERYAIMSSPAPTPCSPILVTTPR